MFMKYIFTVLFSICSVFSWAQTFDFRQQNDVKVVVGTDTLRQPWVGGLNSPVFSTIDLNQDGTQDLYAFDRLNNKSFTFLADNAGGTWKWKYAPEYEIFFPKDMQYWVLLRDVDGDGRKDLFTGNNSETLVYKNVTPLPGPLTFVNMPVRLRFDSFVNMPLGAYALPSITDVDNDGDLDILVFDSFAAETIEYYKNLRVEQSLPADTVRLTRSTLRWGRVSRCANTCNSFAFGANTCRVSKPLHGGGASILAIDLDGDGDKDALVGADLCPDLVRLTNIGTTALADMNSSSLSTVYPNSTNPASFVNFPAAYYEDVNFDGKNDLLVAPFLSDNLDHAEFARSSWLYANSSATAVPNFIFQQNNFLQDKMVDVGLQASPVFADIDADGDLDMLVGNFADYRMGTTQYLSTVSLYTNVGSATNPIFKLTTNDYLQLSQADYKGIQLQFADLNGDGSKDLIIKYLHSSGQAAYMEYIPNAAPAGQPYSFSRASQTQVAISVNVTDAPFFYDLDGDGDLDLLLGTDSQNPSNPNSGAIHYYKRVGANAGSFSSWQLFDDNFGKIARDYTRRSVQPIIADFNHDNVADLLLTDNSGEIRLYPSITNNLTGTFLVENTVVFNPVLNGFVPTAFGTQLHAVAADLNGDQRPEIIIGTNGGGMVYLKNQSTVTGIKKDLAALSLNVYPNPASEVLTITSAEKVQVSVYDISGKLLLQTKEGFRNIHELNVAGLKPGAYFLKISTPDFRSAGRSFIVQH